MHYVESGCFHAELGAIVPNNRALCRIVEIECTISKQRALAPKLTVKRCICVGNYDILHEADVNKFHD